MAMTLHRSRKTIVFAENWFRCGRFAALPAAAPTRRAAIQSERRGSSAPRANAMIRSSSPQQLCAVMTDIDKTAASSPN
jgi:hypothetical protein